LISCWRTSCNPTGCGIRLEQRALAVRNAWIISRGGTPIAEASMAKVAGTERRTRIANTGMDLLGRYGALSKKNGALAPAEGRMERAFRISPSLEIDETQTLLRDTVRGAPGLARAAVSRGAGRRSQRTRAALAAARRDFGSWRCRLRPSSPLQESSPRGHGGRDRDLVRI
jgi:hypothetical protein